MTHTATIRAAFVGHPSLLTPEVRAAIDALEADSERLVLVRNLCDELFAQQALARAGQETP